MQLLVPNAIALAVKRFFGKVLKPTHHQSAQVINVDRNPAAPKAIEELKPEKFW